MAAFERVLFAAVLFVELLAGAGTGAAGAWPEACSRFINRAFRP